MYNLGLKSACCEQSRNHLTLKMLGVCSTLQVQFFWLLNHSMSSSYERVMIKIRNQKLQRILHGISNIYGGKRDGEEREFDDQSKRDTSPSTCGPRVAHVGREVSSTCGTRGSHVDSKLGQWPCLFLSRTSRVLQPYSGIRTPNLNLFSDYKS